MVKIYRWSLNKPVLFGKQYKLNIHSQNIHLYINTAISSLFKTLFSLGFISRWILLSIMNRREFIDANTCIIGWINSICDIGRKTAEFTINRLTVHYNTVYSKGSRVEYRCFSVESLGILVCRSLPTGLLEPEDNRPPVVLKQDVPIVSRRWSNSWNCPISCYPFPSQYFSSLYL